MSLDDFFFRLKIGKDNMPLFKRPVDIVRAILKNNDTPYYCEASDPTYITKFKNLKVYVSQVLKGVRNPTEDLKKSFKIVIKNNLNSNENINQRLNQLDEELNRISLKVFKTPDIDSQLIELNQKVKTAKSQIIFTPRPVETIDNDQAIEITDSLLENLGLLDDKFNQSKIYVNYEFHFPIDGIAIEFYERLFRRIKFLKPKLTESEIVNRFEQLNKNYFKVYIVDPINCVFPHSIFNYDSTNPTGFILFVHVEDNYSVAKMSQAGIVRWYNSLYLSAKTKRIEVLFVNVKDKIKL